MVRPTTHEDWENAIPMRWVAGVQLFGVFIGLLGYGKGKLERRP